MLQECDICKATVDAQELASYQGSELEDDGFVHLLHYTFMKCPRCERPFVVSHEANPRFAEFPLWAQTAKTLLPQPYKRVDPNLPPTVRSAFEEALTCLRSGAYSATVLLSRKTLEAMCHENKINGNNLAQMLKTAMDANVIDGRLFQWANALRLAGNRAPHDVVGSITRLDAMDIVDFTHAMLEYIFTFRDKFNAFMAGEEKRHYNRAGGSKDEEAASAQEELQGSGTDVRAPN